MLMQHKAYIFILALCLLCCSRPMSKQPSDLEEQNRLVKQDMNQQQMLLKQAKHDGTTVSEDSVEVELNNRIAYFVTLYGSKEKLEHASGKTIDQIKQENRDMIRMSMVAEKEQRIMQVK